MTLLVINPSYAARIHSAIAPGSGPLEAVETIAGPRTVQQPNLLDRDRDMVRSWAKQEFEAKPVKIEPVDNSGTYSVSWFKLDNGNIVQVHTWEPESKWEQKTSN